MAPDEPKPSEKRRLPILQSAPEPPRGPHDEAEEDRPAWRRMALGVAATFLVWLPLSALVEAIVRRVFAVHAAQEAAPSAGPALISGHALAFCAGALAGGVLVGRLGADRARREGALTGGLAALLSWLIALGQGTPGGALVWALLLVILMTLGGGAGSVGGRLGERFRARPK